MRSIIHCIIQKVQVQVRLFFFFFLVILNIATLDRSRLLKLSVNSPLESK